MKIIIQKIKKGFKLFCLKPFICGPARTLLYFVNFYEFLQVYIAPASKV